MLLTKINNILNLVFFIFFILFFIFSLNFIYLLNLKDSFLLVVLAIPILSVYIKKNRGIFINQSYLSLVAILISIITVKLFSSIYRFSNSLSYLISAIFTVMTLLLIACILIGITNYLVYKKAFSAERHFAISISISTFIFITTYILIINRQLLFNSNSHSEIFNATGLFPPLLLLLILPFQLSNLLAIKVTKKVLFLLLSIFVAVIILSAIYKTSRSVFYYSRGNNFEKHQDFSNAINKYNLSYQYNPLFVSPRFRIANIYAKNNNFKEAIREYEFLARNTFDTTAHFFLGQIYEKLFDRKQAIEEFSKIHKEDKYYQAAKITITQLFIEEKDWGRAFDSLSEFESEEYFNQLKFSSALDCLDFANMLYSKNNLKKSLYFFKHAINLNGKEQIIHLIYYNLAKVYYDLREFPQAKFYFGEAYKLQPNNLSILCFLNELENGYSEIKANLQKDIEAILSKLPTLTINNTSKLNIYSISVYEAEDLSHHVGKIALDKYASEGKSWYANEEADKKGEFMAFGPPLMLPYGEYKAYFRLKTKVNNSNRQVCGIDVIGFNNNNIFLYLASKPIRYRDFLSTGSYRDFELNFHNPGNVFLQFRIQFINGEVWADRVVVSPAINMN